jgi:beta-lactamase regulating signal transducer with metallopeptidase domain
MTATQWLEVLASFSLQVLVVVVVCKVLTRAVARPSDHSAIWTTCFLCILSLAVAGLVLPRLHLFQPWSQLEPQTIMSASTAQNVIGKSLLAVWCVGACASLISWITSAYFVRRLLNRCEAQPTRYGKSLFDLAGLKFDRRRTPRVLISDEVQAPFCLQLHQPTVVLPRYLLDCSTEDLRHVLIHEFEHLNTNHPLHLFLQHAAQVICWFHPFVWNAAWHASMAREFSCDDAATAQRTNCAAYLRTLLHIAERGENRKYSAGIAFGRAPSELIMRARRLVKAATEPKLRRRFVLVGRRTAISILLCAAGLTAVLTIPLDPLSSSRATWSPWPKWTAGAVHCFGYALRDYEPFDGRVQLYELQRECDAQSSPQNDLVVND